MKKILQVGGFAGILLAIGVTVAYLFAFIELELYVTLLGVGGFAGLAGLRDAIASSGYKTYIIAAGGTLISIGVGFGAISPERAVVILGILGIGSIPTLAHAVKKAK